MRSSENKAADGIGRGRECGTAALGGEFDKAADGIRRLHVIKLLSIRPPMASAALIHPAGGGWATSCDPTADTLVGFDCDHFIPFSNHVIASSAVAASW